MLRRRGLLSLAALVAAASRARAGSDAVTIGWPSDVPSWDPNQRLVPDAQSLYKAVFDQPLDQAPSLALIPSVLTGWSLAPDALSLEASLREDVLWHDGSRLTAEDFRYTFLERPKGPVRLDTASSWRKVSDIAILSPTRVRMVFSSPAPTAPQWLAFMGSFLVPKAYVEKLGAEGFAQKPVGSGPYRLAEYEMNSRIVLERNDAYWGPKPRLRRVTVQVIKDPSARVAAVQSGQVDLAFSLPVREVARLGQTAGLAGELNPITRIILLQIRNDMGFADANVRLAAHHAIDKAALSKAFYGGAARPLSVDTTPGSPGDVPEFHFAYDPDLARQLLAKAGFSPDKPAKIGLASFNGQFPADYDIARALVAMWKKVGIEADLSVIEYAKYFELNRGGKLPEATLYSWDNATADPEIFIGYNLNPKLPFSPWKDMALGQRVLDLFNTADYAQRIAGYKALEVAAVEQGASIPLLQSVSTLVRKQALDYTKYGNGWLLPQTIGWR
jgi:peptide/nickel transport system substrate-binding protein